MPDTPNPQLPRPAQPLRSLLALLLLATGFVAIKLVLSQPEVGRAGVHEPSVRPALGDRAIEGESSTQAALVGAQQNASLSIHVVDAATGEPIEDARIYTAESTAADHAPNQAVEGDRLVVRSSRDHLRAATVGSTPPKRMGHSPLRFDRRAGQVAYIGAPGYGWANFFPSAEVPETVIVMLERVARLELRADGLPRDARATVTLDDAESHRLLANRWETGSWAKGLEFDGLPPGEVLVSVSASSLEAGLRYRGSARVRLAPGETVEQSINLRRTATRLKLRLRMPESADERQRVTKVRYGTPNSTSIVNVRRTGAEDGFAIFEPTEVMMVEAGSLIVTVLPHGLSFQREVDALDPLEWDIELPLGGACSVQVWDVLNDRPYDGPVSLQRLPSAADEREANALFGGPRRPMISYCDALLRDADGITECLLPNSRFRFLTEPEALIVSTSKIEWNEHDDRPAFVLLEVRPLARLTFSVGEWFDPGSQRFHLEDATGERVDPAAFGAPLYFCGMGPDQAFVSLDTDGRHWLVREDRPETDPTHRVQVDLTRGELAHVTNQAGR